MKKKSLAITGLLLASSPALACGGPPIAFPSLTQLGVFVGGVFLFVVVVAYIGVVGMMKLIFRV